MASDPAIDPQLQYSHQQPYQPRPSTTTNAGDHLPYFLSPGHTNKPSPLDPSLQQLTPAGTITSPENEHDHDDEDDQAGDPGSASAIHGGDATKRSRACDNCRSLKVRCELPDDPADPQCKRCKRTKKHCVTSPPTKKRQKKDVSLITQLKQQVDELSAVVRAQAAQQTTITPQETTYSSYPNYVSASGFPASSVSYSSSQSHLQTPPGQSYTSVSRTWSERDPHEDPTSPENKKRRLESDSGRELQGPRQDQNSPSAPEQSVHPQDKCQFHHKPLNIDHSDIVRSVDRIMSPEMAEVVFERYRKDVCIHFPAVVLAPDVTAKETREKKPLLFLAIITAASFSFAPRALTPSVQNELVQLLKDQFADIIWRNGEKSLEIIQALQVGVLWYRPPQHFEQNAFYLMANTAVITSLDLGIGKHANPAVAKMNFPFRRALPNTGSIEARRALLISYYLALSITMVMRRPIVLHWSRNMDESVDMLETSPDALPSDRNLCYHVRLTKLAEDIATQFAMDDSSAAVTMADSKVVYAVNGFRRELANLKSRRTQDASDALVTLSEHVLNLYIHEVALHTSQNMADFYPPYHSAHERTQEKHEIFGHSHVEALSQCLASCHGILESFITMPAAQRCTMPVIFCVRIIYAIVCLMKMWVAIDSPGNMGEVINEKDLKVEEYLDRVVSTFESFVQTEGHSPHGKFFFISKRLRSKFKHIKAGGDRGPDGSSGCPGGQDERQASVGPTERQPTSNTSQTPLHLLSEVAMGNSAAQQRQTLQPQPQQEHQPHSAISTQPAWYGNSGTLADFQDVNFDPNLDLGMIDFRNLAMLNTDFSGLITNDGLWQYPMPYDPNSQPLSGF